MSKYCRVANIKNMMSQKVTYYLNVGKKREAIFIVSLVRP